MSTSEQDLISWKTDAWKDRNMVAWYSQRMVQNVDTNRLKNIVEIELCERFLSGQDVLDVGIGTGRASLPLIAKGYRLSGTDSSQAMLDECQRLAGGQPITLKQGDVQQLPFDDQSFDSLISLNVMTHFPHVEPVLQEWKRVVRPGGRLIFDIYSLDHLSFARGRNVTVEELMEQGANAFNMHLSGERLCSAANEVGLKVLGIVPYGSFICGEYRHPAFSMPLQNSAWWRRQMTWLASDDSLLELAVFIEQHFFGCLSAIATGRFMVVLENSPDEQANQLWLDQDRQLSGYLQSASPIRLDDLAPWLNMPPDAWRQTFDNLLSRARNRGIAYMLMSSCLGRLDALDWQDLAPSHGSRLNGWSTGEFWDRNIQSFVKEWHRSDEMKPYCELDGESLPASLEYQLQRNLVALLSQPPAGDAE
ncbi:hypothetical protein DK842_04460 [Chromobacterium phragmitis]|uniref:Class I SAM-dependent methyltransferase n=1 Tax=Chromobacterium phragmitis TaxID=2202141 RepID=A0A344UH40_9NEIS|nr:class I SAM-dependent methyltransferase [Chromobacterium phragmitis]AXE29229.1 hypothetical protein DK842_04460 [Chromobacterium phragmitis]AXE34588.1 hypothetical protein DK843_09925 [Chromobacterium phragmitis]